VTPEPHASQPIPAPRTARAGRRLISLGLALAVLVATVAACSSDEEGATHQVAGQTVTEAEWRYGGAPAPPGDDVGYRPDVVLSTPQVVRELSSDGFHVTLDPEGENVAALEVGKVAFVSGRVVGRVLAIEDTGAGRQLLLGPVELTEVFETLQFDTTSEIDPESLAIHNAPGMPGTVEPIDLLTDEEAAAEPDDTEPDDTEPDDTEPDDTEPDATEPGGSEDPGGDDGTATTDPEETDPGADDPDAIDPATGEPTGPSGAPDAGGDDGASFAPPAAAPAAVETIEMPPLQLVAGRARAAVASPAVPAQVPPVPLPVPPPLNTPTVVETGDFKIQPNLSGGVGAQFSYDKGGTKIAAKIGVRLEKPSLKAKIDLRGGKVNQAHLELSGSAGFYGSFIAGSEVGLDANINANIALPIDLTVPLFGVPGPFAVTFSQRLIVKSAFSSKNATLSAKADFAFGGNFLMGIVDGKQTLGGPTSLTVNTSLLDTARGVLVGPGAVILAHAMRVMVGVGAFGLAAGLYVDFITSFSATKGSSLSPIVCVGGSLDMVMAGGVGYSIPQPITSAINFVLRALNLKQVERTGGLEFARTTLISKKAVKPERPICQG
jgi:hypothetical protein